VMLTVIYGTRVKEKSGFGGLEVACWPLVPEIAGSNPAEAVGFFGRKNPQHAFLRRGSKAVGPMSRFTVCKTWKSPLSAKFSAISRSQLHLPLLGSLASPQTLGASCGEKLERSKSLVLLQVVGLTCRWQRHSVKPSC
jgi:hypothetical protein